MNIPNDHPDLADVAEAQAALNAAVGEYLHLFAARLGFPHLNENGGRVQFQSCPNEPCVSWRRFESTFLRFQAGRLP